MVNRQIGKKTDWNIDRMGENGTKRERMKP